MSDDFSACEFCGSPLTRVGNLLEIADWFCSNPSCEYARVNQASRFCGEKRFQVIFRRNEIIRFEHGRPSQGEDNCYAVSKALLEWLGSRFNIGTPCSEERNSRAERGFDFTLREPCGHETEVQVTRLHEKDYYAKLGSGEPVLSTRQHSELVDLIDKTVRAKADRTPEADRNKRILAIDGRSPAISLNLFLVNVAFVDLAEVFGWRAVILVIDPMNTRILDRDTWPPCPSCVI